MNNTELKDLIVEHVIKTQGCKGPELASALTASSYPDHCLVQDLYNALEDLLAEKRIIKISYVLPYTEYRENSFYLPGKTQITVIDW